MIGVPAHKLRYLEKTASAIQITKIRGRRYYTSEDINKIKTQFFKITKLQADLSYHLNTATDPMSKNEILPQIEDLLSKFTLLLQKIS